MVDDAWCVSWFPTIHPSHWMEKFTAVPGGSWKSLPGDITSCEPWSCVHRPSVLTMAMRFSLGAVRGGRVGRSDEASEDENRVTSDGWTATSRYFVTMVTLQQTNMEIVNLLLIMILPSSPIGLEESSRNACWISCSRQCLFNQAFFWYVMAVHKQQHTIDLNLAVVHLTIHQRNAWFGGEWFFTNGEVMTD